MRARRLELGRIMVPRVAGANRPFCHMSRVMSPFTAEDQSHKPLATAA
jgi:hypothetical protein